MRADPHRVGRERQEVGWAWALKLADELARLPEPRWARALAPMAEIFARAVGASR
jgi:hypothetical protein